jgi:LPXTG-motif cell wall-anchored protein
MMKKSVLTFSMTLLLLITGISVAAGQEQPKPKKDTVNMDTNAKPTFYYPVEDSKSKSHVGTIVIIAGAVIVAGAAGFFLLKKKK